MADFMLIDPFKCVYLEHLFHPNISEELEKIVLLYSFVLYVASSALSPVKPIKSSVTLYSSVLCVLNDALKH